MRLALAAVLFVHGFAHLPGLLVAWRFANLKELPYKTTLLARSRDRMARALLAPTRLENL